LQLLVHVGGWGIRSAKAASPCPFDRELGKTRSAMARRNRITNTTTLVLTALLCLGGAHGWAQQQDDQQQMRGLDEQVQEIKSEVLGIAEELSRLEEKLLYPSGTQVAIFVALADGERMRLDAVRLQIDGQLVAHYIYSAKELEALRKGGVQRIYVGNVATGNHQLEVLVDAKLEDGKEFSHTQSFGFRKEVKPALVGLTLAGSGSGNTPITLAEW
jgi:hypothetical protein